MSKHLHTIVTKLPKVEPAFKAALEAIAKSEKLTLEQLLADIKKQPGTSLAAKARLYAINYYRDNTLPCGFAESSSTPFETALRHVREHKPPKKR